MPPNVYRSKLLNAVLFFCKNTRYLNKTKLLKLLYYLDFIHFKQTGIPSIGLTYYTYRKGPVPVRFWKEISGGVVPSDFKGKLEIVVKQFDHKELRFIANRDSDLSFFTPREQEIMRDLAKRYKYTRATQMSEETHLPNQPWDTTIKTRGSGKIIDYLLCLDNNSKISWEQAKDNLTEFYAAVRNFKLVATKPAQQ